MTDNPLWGKQTDLAVRNFPVARRPLHTHVAKSLAAVKRHAASVNASLGVSGVDEELAAAIADAAQTSRPVSSTTTSRWTSSRPDPGRPRT